MAYHAKSQKRYSEKTMTFALKYYPTDIEEGKRLKSYIEESNISINAFLKMIVKKELDSIGYIYKKEDNL